MGHLRTIPGSTPRGPVQPGIAEPALTGYSLVPPHRGAAGAGTIPSLGRVTVSAHPISPRGGTQWAPRAGAVNSCPWTATDPGPCNPTPVPRPLHTAALSENWGSSWCSASTPPTTPPHTRLNRTLSATPHPRGVIPSPAATADGIHRTHPGAAFPH